LGVRVQPIAAADLPAVASFLHRELNPDVPERAWVAALSQPWLPDPPNHGMQLLDDGRVVGAYVAYYSAQEVDGEQQSFCNLGAWCVLEPYRTHGIRLLTNLLSQRGFHFTDFSPSGNVVPLNRRLKLTELDTTTALIPNLPWPRTRGVEVVTSLPEIERRLSGLELRRFHDHRDAGAAHHVVLSSSHGSCYVVFRKDSRKGVRAFASILHVSDPELFHRYAHHLGHHLLTRHGAVATLVELRLVGRAPRGARVLGTSRPRFFKSPSLRSDQISYLYSELACLAW
jgi:hypothetical protein